MKTVGTAMLLLMASMLASCASMQHVEPWQKGYLARPEMTFAGDKLDVAYTEHTYFSKEAASGGGGVSGGGCGCN